MILNWQVTLEGTKPKHHQDYVATHSFLGPGNTKAMVTTENPSWRRFSAVVNANNKSPVWSIGFVISSCGHAFVSLMKLCVPFLLLFHIARWFATTFNSNPILWTQSQERAPLTHSSHLIPHHRPRCSPTLVDHKTIFGNKPYFCSNFWKKMPSYYHIPKIKFKCLF